MPVITSAANPAVKSARKLLRRRRRAESGRFLVEGPQALAAARGRLEEVFVSPGADPSARAAALVAAEAGAALHEVADDVIATISTAVTPRGVVGVARLDEPDLDEALDGATFALLCCEVADPGNVGAIVRTADAAGADAVVLSADSVDARNPKAVRATAGSLFHLPVICGIPVPAALEAARRHGLRTVAADAAGPTAHTAADLRGPVLLVLGGEARGLPTETLAACDAVVRVPMHTGDRPNYGGCAESLNLAATAAIISFEIVRQRSRSESRA